MRARAFVRKAETFRLAGKPAEALRWLDRAVTLDPASQVALYARVLTFQALSRLDEALEACEALLQQDQAHADALFKRGNVLLRLGRFAQALQSYDLLLALKPEFPDAHFNRGLVLQGLKRTVEAIDNYNMALHLKPDDAEALNNRGNAFLELRKLDAALASYDEALAIRPEFADALYNRALTLQELKRPALAAQGYAQLLEVAPAYDFALGRLLHAKMMACDWRDFHVLQAAVAQGVRQGRRVIEPFSYLGISDSESDLKKCSEIHAKDIGGGTPTSLPAKYFELKAEGRIRIAYVSGEFRQQATSVLMVELLELHDRSRFEIFAFDNGWDDGSPLRQRIDRAVDHMVDISGLNDQNAAAEITKRGVHVLVDLNGYFGFCRPGVFRLKPAPVQVNYLGFPGTLGTGWMDYILADEFVIPPSSRAHYSEKVVYLPDSYQANDSRRGFVRPDLSREDFGLPPDGFVFCCFNNNFKITPFVFDAWARILTAVEGSVLWLLEDNPSVRGNLRREAKARGVNPDHLVFAKRVGLQKHLERHGAADLFLDTLPCNAHTTASDALWAGLPVLTCRGTTFSGRVAASLLHAVGLPELVAPTLGDYEALAIALARSPDRLKAIKSTLVHHRSSNPLFDAPRLCRHVEWAYSEMWSRHLRGLEPEGFGVPRMSAAPLKSSVLGAVRQAGLPPS